MRGRIPFPRDRRTSPFSRWTRRSNRLLGWPCPAPTTPSDLGGPCWRLGGSRHAFFFLSSTHVDVALGFETRNHRLSTARSFRRPSFRLVVITRPPLSPPPPHTHTEADTPQWNSCTRSSPLCGPPTHAPRSIVHEVCLPLPLCPSLSPTRSVHPAHTHSPSPLSLSIPVDLSPSQSLSHSLSLSISLRDPLPLNLSPTPSPSQSLSISLPLNLSQRPSPSQSLSLSPTVPVHPCEWSVGTVCGSGSWRIIRRTVRHAPARLARVAGGKGTASKP